MIAKAGETRGSRTAFFKYDIGVFMCFVERETQNFILKLREIFTWRETVPRAHGVKSDGKTVLLSNLCNFLRYMKHVVIDRYFSLFLKGFEEFS